MVSKVPIYNACTGLLTESLEMFNRSDDIYIGIDAALEKLNHYYDKISPMVGIALILNPTKKQNYFKEELGWKKNWVESVLDQFYSAFRYYKTLIRGNASSSSNPATNSNDATDQFENYMKRKLSVMESYENSEEEYVRYLRKINLGILMHHYQNLELMSWHFGRPIRLIILYYQQWLRII